MCGITGLFSYENYLDKSLIVKITDIIAHRGPDDEGYLAVNVAEADTVALIGKDSKISGLHIDHFNKMANLFLGHRRLAIIDTSPSGHQPMSNPDRTCWIIYNGEIYNYLELREELKNYGHHFFTQTDTEVILAAYGQWGQNCVNRFNGMWSFAIFDKAKNILFGSRDRFGVKPFYYFYNGKYFAFASEIKALLKIPFIDNKVNSAAVFDYLALGFEEREEEGFFKGIFELFPSHSFELDLKTGAFKKWKYYELEYNDSWQRFSESKLRVYLSDIKELIFSTVNLRLRSDVPVGSCLSGGLDSSAIVCVINNLLKRNFIAQVGETQNVFTASYNNSAIDESVWAGKVVNTTKTSWHRTYPSAADLLKELEDFVYSQDIPFGSTSIYAQYRVMRLAKETGIKVLLDGQGGDELFTGYIPYYRAFFYEIIKNGDILRLLYELANFKNYPMSISALLISMMRMSGFSVLPENIRIFIAKRAIKEKQYISFELWENYKGRLDIIKDKFSTSLNHMLYNYMTGKNLKTLLRYEDRNSMRFSMESRTPFADDIKLIEYVFKIPSVYKIHEGWSKYLLRESMANVLPTEIKQRKDKIGFASPEYCWLNEIKDELKPFIRNELRRFIDTDRLLKDWDTLFRIQPANGIINIWRTINLAVWMKVYDL